MFSGETANPSIWSHGTLGKGTSAQPLPDHEDNQDDQEFPFSPPTRLSSPHAVFVGAPYSGLEGLQVVLIIIR